MQLIRALNLIVQHNQVTNRPRRLRCLWMVHRPEVVVKLLLSYVFVWFLLIIFTNMGWAIFFFDIGKASILVASIPFFLSQTIIGAVFRIFVKRSKHFRAIKAGAVVAVPRALIDHSGLFIIKS